MTCRAAELRVREGGDDGETKHRALSKVVRVRDARVTKLKTFLFALFLLLGIAGLLSTLGLRPAIAIPLGALASALGALAYYRAQS